MSGLHELDAGELLRRVAARIPVDLRARVVVIGSIAAAWAFREVSGTHAVATKDIDLLLRPAIDAVVTAETLGQSLIDAGWQPRSPADVGPGSSDRPPEHDQRPPTSGSITCTSP